MARLSVNLNKVALLRNSRHTGVPDVLQFARIAIDAGAHGLTVHPRPDERHIRRADVSALAALMHPRRPGLEFNIEGYPDERFLAIAAEVSPEQCTLVPDAPSAFTSEEGWRLDAGQMQLVRPVIASLKARGSRVILFIDPEPGVVERVVEAGADGIEIYTGAYAHAFRRGEHGTLLEACAATAARAAARGLVINAGHDLNLQNLPPLMARVPFLAEASIGHELTADALVIGFAAAVRAYATALAMADDGRDRELRR
jgi:pyridoxine 5-phosphate synthase